MKLHTGIGFDTHRLVEGRRLVLGGVEIPHTLGLLGHSDADVLAHAIMDALLGAIAAGDIGHLFPDSDPAYEGADSLALLRRVAALVRELGWHIENIDATVMAERPKLAPHIDAMRARLAEAAGIPVEDVSVKATTMEKMGHLGREEGIGAMAVATVVQ
jgi:2-C-methyl-D-erythritol 2,4-cyclodiphosphate synthase